MNWNKGIKEQLQNIEHVEYEKYVLNMSQRDYTAETEQSEEGEVDNSDVEYIPVIIEGIPSTDRIKNALIDLQKKYDVSDEVNSFTVNGIQFWMDKNTRNSLKETLNVVEKNGATTYTLWLGDQPLEVSIQTIREFLDALELYAIACYQVTSTHLAEIRELNNKDSLFKYDISNGYPNKINMNV